MKASIVGMIASWIIWCLQFSMCFVQPETTWVKNAPELTPDTGIKLNIYHGLETTLHKADWFLNLWFDFHWQYSWSLYLQLITDFRTCIYYSYNFGNCNASIIRLISFKKLWLTYNIFLSLETNQPKNKPYPRPWERNSSPHPQPNYSHLAAAQISKCNRTWT